MAHQLTDDYMHLEQRRELCRLNNLPPSTMTTTPHLLHTRSSIILPPSAVTAGEPRDDHENASRRARERAEKKLQMLTKEVDWRVAKAYVALADDAEEVRSYELKCKEGNERVDLEMMAINKYLEDDEWEASERRQGRSVCIPAFILSDIT